MLIPAIIKDKPFLIVPNELFVDSLEAIQNWKIIAGRSNVRFGLPRSFDEASACIKKVISDTKGLNEGMKGLLTTYPRFFQQSRLLPILLSNAFNSEQTLYDAVTEGYMSLILLNDKFQSSEDPDKPVRKFISMNLHMTIRAFLKVNEAVRASLNLD